MNRVKWGLRVLRKCSFPTLIISISAFGKVKKDQEGALSGPQDTQLSRSVRPFVTKSYFEIYISYSHIQKIRAKSQNC